MSVLLDNCFAEINKIEGLERVSSIPSTSKHYVECWKLSTEVEVSDVRHDLVFYIGFSESFPYVLPDFYFPSLDYGYLPHVESKNGKICLYEDGSAFSLENPLSLLMENIKKAKRLIKEGIGKTNFEDFKAEINSYWSREYNNEPDIIETVIFFDDWPTNDTVLSELIYEVPLPLDKRGTKITNYLLYVGDNEPFNGFISDNYHRNATTKALFLQNVEIKECAPYNLTFETFLNLLTQEGRRRTRSFLNRNNGGDIFFKLTDNRIAGISFERTNPKKNGYRNLKPCYIYEHFGNNTKNKHRLYGFVYSSRKAAERTSGHLLPKKRFIIVGLGSIGSNLVHYLLEYDNLSFTLIDMDILTTDNLGRHLLGYRYINLTKVHGVANYIKSMNIDAEVRPITNTIQEYIGYDFNKLNDATAIFVCAGDVMTEKFINDAITRGDIKVPVFHLWLEPYGGAGHLLYVNPEQCKSSIDIYNEHFRYIHNIIKDEEYDKHSDMFIKRTAGCNGSYTLYSQNDVLLMFSAFYPIINRLIQEPSESKCYRWVGNKDYLLRQGIELNISPDVQSGTVQEFPL